MSILFLLEEGLSIRDREVFLENAKISTQRYVQLVIFFYHFSSNRKIW